MLSMKHTYIMILIWRSSLQLITLGYPGFIKEKNANKSKEQKLKISEMTSYAYVRRGNHYSHLAPQCLIHHSHPQKLIAEEVPACQLTQPSHWTYHHAHLGLKIS